jgi:uncharacterized membrane protein
MSMATPQPSSNGELAGERRPGNGAGAQARNRRESDRRQPGMRDRGERLARGLGWFSLGLGVAQLAAPRALARLIGVRASQRNRKVMRAIGVREIAAGLGILTRQRPADWVWARVGYDMSDLALLGSTLSTKRIHRGRVAAATAAVAGLAILDTLAGLKLGGTAADATSLRARRERASAKAKAITVNCSPEEAYRFWRDLSNLPRFMAHLESVRMIDERRSHWVAKAPAGTTVEWDAEIIDDRPNEFFAWRASAGAKVVSHGTVRFQRAPGGRGTEVLVEIRHEAPGGAFGSVIAKVFGEAVGLHVASDLRRFKQLMETGEIVKSDSSIYPGPHPAQPPARLEGPRQARRDRPSTTEGARP